MESSKITPIFERVKKICELLCEVLLFSIVFSSKKIDESSVKKSNFSSCLTSSRHSSPGCIDQGSHAFS
jgi:hypothetical protein